MHKSRFARRILPSLIVALGAVAGVAEAAPSISRLTPPSNPIVAGATTLARFLPGQRFDLQATGTRRATRQDDSVPLLVPGASAATPRVK